MFEWHIYLLLDIIAFWSPAAMCSIDCLPDFVDDACVVTFSLQFLAILNCRLKIFWLKLLASVHFNQTPMETYYGAVISTQQRTCHPDESSWAGNQGAGQVGPRQYSQEDLWLQLAVPREMILWWQVLNVTDPDAYIAISHVPQKGLAAGCCVLVCYASCTQCSRQPSLNTPRLVMNPDLPSQQRSFAAFARCLFF